MLDQKRRGNLFEENVTNFNFKDVSWMRSYSTSKNSRLNILLEDFSKNSERFENYISFFINQLGAYGAIPQEGFEVSFGQKNYKMTEDSAWLNITKSLSMGEKEEFVDLTTGLLIKGNLYFFKSNISLKEPHLSFSEKTIHNQFGLLGGRRIPMATIPEDLSEFNSRLAKIVQKLN